MRLVFETGTPFHGEVRRVRRDGTTFWAESHDVPIRNAEGELCEIVVLLRDTTMRRLRRADEGGQIAAINRSQAVLHLALDATILDANPLFPTALGYDLNEVVGRHHRMFLDPAELTERFRTKSGASGGWGAKAASPHARAIPATATHRPVRQMMTTDASAPAAMPAAADWEEF